MAVNPDGRIFPYGQTLGDERFAVGTIWAPELANRMTPHAALVFLKESVPVTAPAACIITGT
jgi:hypothetical protein